MTDALTLYGYWRSSATYRVRIALNLKDLDYRIQPVHLVDHGGEHHAKDYARRNPQELVPMLVHGGQVLTQSLAIIEYLEEVFPNTARLLPESYAERARIRAFAQAISSEIAPLQNLRVLNEVKRHGIDSQAWARQWIGTTLAALETMADSAYCVGEGVSMAECFLVPQMYNARRFGVDLTKYPKLTDIDAKCNEMKAFRDAHPDQQPDAPQTDA